MPQSSCFWRTLVACWLTSFWLLSSSQSCVMFAWASQTTAGDHHDAADPHGHLVPDVRHIDGVALQRNGHGVRSISFFGMDIKVYVAGFYSESPLVSPEQVMESHSQKRPMQLDFTFLRNVGKSRVISAWTQQLEHSVSYHYDGYEDDRDKFVTMFSNPISDGGTQTVQLVGDDTILVHQGTPQGRIAGSHFQKAFLSMWFGERVVAEDLKSNLLAGGTQQNIKPSENEVLVKG